MKLFAPFSKVVDQPDGTIRVFGIASSSTRDSDNEITSPDAIRKALPAYLRHGSGALREMHQPIAAGKVDEIDVDKDGITRVAALVVDDSSIKKVKTGVLKGFSIGGRVTERSPMDPREITGCELVEISLVDRPANPDATITLWKADMSTSVTGAEAFIADPPNMTGPLAAELVFTFANAKKAMPVGSIHVEAGEPIRTAEFDRAIEEIFTKRTFSSKEREAAAASGAAMHDGSYPIENASDLHNAIRAVGRGKNNSHAAIRAHIRRRAKALGLTSALPDTWDKIDKGMDTVCHLANILASIDILQRNSEIEQDFEKDSKAQPEAIKAWLKDGVKLLESVVREEGAELIGMAETSDGSAYDLTAKAAIWMNNIRVRKSRVKLMPKVGDTVQFVSGEQHGGLGGSTGEVKGYVHAVDGDHVTVRHDGSNHMQDFIWPHLDGSFSEEKKAWLMKRGSRHSAEDRGHLQTAHDALVKMGAICAAAEDEDLGKRVRALSPERREIVEQMLKLSIKPPAKTDAEKQAAEAAQAAATAASADAIAKAASSGDKDAITKAINDAVATVLTKATSAQTAQPTGPDFTSTLGFEMDRLQEQMTVKMGAAIAGAVEKLTAQYRSDIAPLQSKINEIAAQPLDPKGSTRVVLKSADGKDPTAPSRSNVPNDAVLESFRGAFSAGPDITSVAELGGAYDFLQPAK